MMQANIGLNNDQVLFGGRTLIILIPYHPNICILITKKERTNGMAHFGDIAKAFNNLALKVSKRGGSKNINGLYLRTLMVFMAYTSLPDKECNAQNAKSYLLNKLDFDANVATISRNTSVLRDLGLITSVEDPTDARVKIISCTTLGKEFANLMR
jgi:hypothetical protein